MSNDTNNRNERVVLGQLGQGRGLSAKAWVQDELRKSKGTVLGRPDEDGEYARLVARFGGRPVVAEPGPIAFDPFAFGALAEDGPPARTYTGLLRSADARSAAQEETPVAGGDEVFRGAGSSSSSFAHERSVSRAPEQFQSDEEGEL